MPSKKLIELRNLFLATSILTVGAAGAVQAQENSSETVTVTGTRIVRDGYNAPTPLAVVSAEQIETIANANLQTFSATCRLSGGFQRDPRKSNANGGANAGLSVLNLRGLGANRTLVLLDGRRMTVCKRERPGRYQSGSATAHSAG